MISGLPDAAVGAIAAALIAGLVSLLGLIISKEQKTSEFRQAWIDALRADLSDFLTRINAVQDAVRVPYKTDAAKLSALQPHYLGLNKANFNILLRINPEEKRSKDILECMGQFNKLAQNHSDLTVSNIRPIQAEILRNSQVLLKYEWNRVKSGELTFKIAKAVALAVIALSIVGAGYLIFTRREPPPKPVAATSKAVVAAPAVAPASTTTGAAAPTSATAQAAPVPRGAQGSMQANSERKGDH